MIHDAWIAFVIVANADFLWIDEVTIKYRQHDRQQIGVSVRKKIENTSHRERYAKDIELAQQTNTRVKKILREINARPQTFARKDFTKTMWQKGADELDRRILHYEARKNLPLSKVKRIAPIVRELLSGHYHEISKGFLSAAKDLFADF